MSTRNLQVDLFVQVLTPVPTIMTYNMYLVSANRISYPITIFFAKLCILLFYLRIFNFNRTLQIIVYAGIALLAAFYLAMIGLAITSLLTCNGFKARTNPFCEAYAGPIQLMSGVFNVVTDFWILLLPFPLLAKLKLRLRQKLGVATVFAAGLA